MKMQSIIDMLDGIYYCHNDQQLTIEECGTKLSSLLGYSSEEIRSLFHNHLLELILPETQSLVNQQFKGLLSKNEYAEFEFPLQHKDGRTIWVSNKCKLCKNDDGSEFICGVMTDITSYKQSYFDTCKYIQHYKIILSQTENIVFELNCETDTIFFSDTWERIFGYSPRIEHFIANFITKSRMHPDDIAPFLERFEILKSGGIYQMMEARIQKADGNYLWCRIRATAVYDNSDRLIKIIGIVINVDAEKKAANALLQRAEQDPLTKLLNNGTARHQAEEYLNAFPLGARCALLILDLDNFKQVNDQHGHMFGDNVLINTAREIKNLFRSRDIVARIGGDEFLILMKEVADHNLVKDRCQQLVQSIHTLLSKEPFCCSSSCSIGVAFAPEHGISYNNLFQHADQALYEAKKLGKNRFSIYNESEA